MQPGGADPWQQLLGALTRLRSRWPRRGWSWDTRLNCVTSSFSTDVEAEARAIAREALPVEWNTSTLSTAPPRMRDLAERCGGLRSGQFLLAAGPIVGVFAYGLWWPWGDGVTVSLRIGLDIPVMQDPYPRFRELFSVSM
jgi:hypothetical protein